MHSSVYKQLFNNENQHWWFRGRRDVIDTYLNKIDLDESNEGDVLDVGTCTGSNLQILSRIGNPEGIDSYLPAVQYCKDHNLNTVSYGNIVNYDSSKKYRLITAFDVIEHIFEEQHAWNNIHNLLVDNGYILVTVPALPFMWSSHDVLHDHFRRYSKSDLENKVSAHNFQVLSISYFNTVLFPFALMERMLLRILGKFGLMKRKIDLFYVPKHINEIFYKVFSFESVYLRNNSFPIGLSLICLARKK